MVVFKNSRSKIELKFIKDVQVNDVALGYFVTCGLIKSFVWKHVSVVYCITATPLKLHCVCCQIMINTYIVCEHVEHYGLFSRNNVTKTGAVTGKLERKSPSLIYNCTTSLLTCIAFYAFTLPFAK